MFISTHNRKSVSLLNCDLLKTQSKWLASDRSGKGRFYVYRFRFFDRQIQHWTHSAKGDFLKLYNLDNSVPLKQATSSV